MQKGVHGGNTECTREATLVDFARFDFLRVLRVCVVKLVKVVKSIPIVPDARGVTHYAFKVVMFLDKNFAEY
jgi:hypothetical protein